MMGIAVSVLTDGRPYLPQAMSSLDEHFPKWPCDKFVMTDDSGDPDYAAQMDTRYGYFDQITHHEARRGLAGALRSSWETALSYDVQYVLNWEDDFVALSRIPVFKMIRTLQENPRLAQVSLKRGPVNDVEAAAGGYIQCAPNAYHQRGGFIEHGVVFTFNPFIARRDVVELCLAEPSDGLERGFTDILLAHGFSFGIYGQINDPPMVDHVGVTRAPGWMV